MKVKLCKFVGALALAMGVASSLQAATPQMTFSSRKYVMGGAANSSSSALTRSWVLGFPNMTLDDMKSLLDIGYDFCACQCGTSWPRNAMQAKDVLTYVNPETSSVELIVVVFTKVDGSYTKCVAAELKNGEGGVWVRGGNTQYVSGSQPDLVFVSLDESGNVVYAGYNLNKSELAGYDKSGYGICGLTLAQVPTTTGKMLVFRNNSSGVSPVTLDDVKDQDFSAYFCGASVARAYVGAEAKGYNKVVTTNENGSATAIRVEFQMKEGSYAKCIVAEFTNGDDGVYAQVLAGRYVSGSLGYAFVNADGTYNGTENTNPGHYGYCSNVGDNSYGIFGIWTLAASSDSEIRYPNLLGETHHVKTVTASTFLSTTWQKVFDGVSLQEVVDGGYEVWGYLCGSSINDNTDIACSGFQSYTPEGTTSISNAVCSFVKYDGAHTKSVSIELETRSDGVYARYGKGQYLNKTNNVNFTFVSLDENGVPVYACDVSGSGATFNDATPTSATAKGYALCGLQARLFMRTESRRVWANATGESVLTLDDIKDYYFGSYMSGSSIRTKGREAIGLNRSFKCDASGSVTNMIVEFQSQDDKYVKCVGMNFTNGVDGVYGYALHACHESGYTVGTKFFNDDGTLSKASYDSTATSDSTRDYGIYELVAVPMWKLEADTDMSGADFVDLGDLVIDMNGHNLTVSGFTGIDGDSDKVYTRIINSDQDTTSELHLAVPPMHSITNTTAAFGFYNSNMQNIKLVKEGSGHYTAACTQYYTGGTVINGGTLRLGIANSSNPLGDANSPVYVGTNAVFDIYGQIDIYNHAVTLNGGTIISSNSSGVQSGLGAQFKTIALTGDAAFDVDNNIGIIGNSYTATSIDLGGHTLTCDIASGKYLYVYNADITAGDIVLTGDGCLKTSSSNASSQNGDVATNTDFTVGCALELTAPLSVHDYTATYTGTSNAGDAALNVYGTFTPRSTNFYGCTMQDGSAIDLSEVTGTWSATSGFTSGSTNVAFAANATVTIKIGERALKNGTKLVSWTTAPENLNTLTFKCVNTEDKEFHLVKNSDGLYYITGTYILIR